MYWDGLRRRSPANKSFRESVRESVRPLNRRAAPLSPDGGEWYSKRKQTGFFFLSSISPPLFGASSIYTSPPNGLRQTIKSQGVYRRVGSQLVQKQQQHQQGEEQQTETRAKEMDCEFDPEAIFHFTFISSLTSSPSASPFADPAGVVIFAINAGRCVSDNNRGWTILINYVGARSTCHLLFFYVAGRQWTCPRGRGWWDALKEIKGA